LLFYLPTEKILSVKQKGDFMGKNIIWSAVKVAAIAGAGSYLWRKMKKQFNFAQKNVFITGGSRGLGISLAWNLLNQGASVALVARDLIELENAKNILLRDYPDADIFIAATDVTDKVQLQKTFERACNHFGNIHLLINNAGAITVAPFEAMEIEDFEAQMKIHLYAIINAIKIAVPHFRKQNRGRILNICSLGGKFAVPHMAPYNASKFALAGLSQAIQPELALDNIVMTTAFPTVMRTGSPIQAVFKGDYRKEFKIFETLDNAPFLSMSADKAAKKILVSVAEGRSEVTLSLFAKTRVVLGALFPELTNAVSKLMVRFLPKDVSRTRVTGADSTNRTRPTKEEEMYNQTPHHNPNYNMGLLH
jgi:short-subunit dehydrogenase